MVIKMSNHLIKRLIVPEVVRILAREPTGLSTTDARDENFVNFMREQLEMRLGVVGSANHCDFLEEQIKLAKQRNEDWERMLKDIMVLYKKLKKSSDTMQPFKKLSQSYPDRFEEQRKKAKEVWIVKKN